MLSDLPPRFFCDFTVSPMRGGITASEEYKPYVHWLADHLHQAGVPLSHDQREWLEQTGRTPLGVISACSERYGFGASDLEFVESHFEPDETYPQWRSRMRQAWEFFYPSSADREENPFDEWLPLSLEVYARLHREWQQGIGTGQKWESVDIPFRSLLSWALRQVPEHEQRFKLLDYYFENFHEASRK